MVLLVIGSILWLERPPVLRKAASFLQKHSVWFWHWSSRWPWFASLLLGGVGLIGIGEYAVGFALIILSLLSLLSKAYHWESPSTSLPSLLRFAAYLLVAIAVPVCF